MAGSRGLPRQHERSLREVDEALGDLRRTVYWVEKWASQPDLDGSEVNKEKWRDVAAHLRGLERGWESLRCDVHSRTWPAPLPPKHRSGSIWGRAQGQARTQGSHRGPR